MRIIFRTYSCIFTYFIVLINTYYSTLLLAKITCLPGFCNMSQEDYSWIFCLTHILLGMLGLRNSLNIPLKKHMKERQQHVHVACVEAWHTCPEKMTQPKASSHFAIRGTDVPQSDDADMLAAHVKT